MLPQRAIVRASGLGLRPLRRLMRQEGWRRPVGAPLGDGGLPPERVARMKALVEGTNLTQRAIARQLRVAPGTVSHRIRRHGWVRPLLEPAPGAPVAFRRPKRSGRPFRGDVLPAVRDLYTGTVLSLGEIGVRTGVSFSYVGKLGRRHGWRRPEGAPLCTRTTRSHGAGLIPRLRDGRARVRALAESWAVAWAGSGADAPEAGPATGRARALAAAAADPAA